ncbi:unnamed protein product [Rhizoctonia solani]|uniref:AMP-dependent synthetase/ligase domain-containing protein n=1 Tax=Rhizoctonia solani TaxID=456999 RepID=A0A8H3BZP9_9AGAM|nr:unnamed protein product [Rhizoctonia solani]
MYSTMPVPANASDWPTASVIYPGPLSNDQLTDNELAILLAIPRWAERTPDATVFRLPLGPEPTHGWVDATFSEARAIVARLATDWRARLFSDAGGLSTGPGTTICLLVEPIAHVLFHWLAFWALGCTVQLVSLTMGAESTLLCLNKSGCGVAIHSGMDKALEQKISSQFKGVMIRLPEEEFAHQLVRGSKHSRAGPLLPWPEPKRPDPAVILHSSGSTGAAKLIQLSLYFYTFPLLTTQRLHTASHSNIIFGSHPLLLFSPAYWQSFSSIFTMRLAIGIPTAFAHVSDIARLPSSHFVSWVQGLNAGEVMCAPRFVRDVLASGSESSINVLQNLQRVMVGGSALEESTGILAEKYNLKFMNAYGCTELGGLLIAQKPPYTHLRPLLGSSPLALPILDASSDELRKVQLWYSRSSSPLVAHLYVKGGVPLNFEPFPGEGPYSGDPAVKLDDIFKEVQDPSGTSYVYAGRTDDLIKLAGNGGWDISASVYETELNSVIASYLASQSSKDGQWTVDGLQLFGNTRPCTALNDNA